MGAPEAHGTARGHAAARPPHPFIYLVLILPFGISSGFVIVTLAYQLAHAGIDTVQVATVVAADLFPRRFSQLSCLPAPRS